MMVNTFRLQKIDDIQKIIEAERDKRASLYKKYNKIINTITKLEAFSAAVGLGLAAGGVTAISGVISSPIGFALEGVAIACGVIALATNFFNNKLRSKVEKHDEIRVLAESKLNTICEHISQALEDGVISQEEFLLITKELAKFNEMKESIRTKQKPASVPDNDRAIQEALDKQKKELIQKFMNSASGSA